MKEYVKTIGIASDHAGFAMKETIKKHLEKQSIKTTDFGTHSADSMDYPDVAHPLANAIEKGTLHFGIALCGSGNGISMTLNKHQGIRAALCWNKELSQLSRQHNDANILTLPARFIDEKTTLEIVDAFLTTEFEGGRHLKRVNKIPCS